MAWRVAFAAAVFVASTVHAHPGPPRAGQITFRQEHETDIAADTSIAGVERGAPDTLYLNVDGGGVWRSTDTGATWAEIYATTGLSKPVLLVRANGDLILADDYAHAWISHDRGDHWIPLAAPPHVSCLVENAAGEVWACTQTLADGAAIMKTTDLASWTPVLRLQDIVGPVACPAGTTQADQCAAGEWCTLAGQLGVMDPTCPMIIPPSSDPGDGTEGDEPTQAAGSCSASSSPSLLMFGIAAVVLATRRRRR